MPNNKKKKKAASGKKLARSLNPEQLSQLAGAGFRGEHPDDLVQSIVNQQIFGQQLSATNVSTGQKTDFFDGFFTVLASSAVPTTNDTLEKQSLRAQVSLHMRVMLAQDKEERIRRAGSRAAAVAAEGGMPEGMQQMQHFFDVAVDAHHDEIVKVCFNGDAQALRRACPAYKAASWDAFSKAMNQTMMGTSFFETASVTNRNHGSDSAAAASSTQNTRVNHSSL